MRGSRDRGTLGHHPHHNGIADAVQRLLCRVLPDDLGIYQTLGVHVAPLDKLYVPDLVVMPTALIAASDPGGNDPVDAAEALPAVEITSRGNAKTDRTKKLWAYAHAPVPAYLLIDRFDAHGPTTSLFTEPQNGAYKHAERAPFGAAVELPEPFFSTPHTASFPR